MRATRVWTARIRSTQRWRSRGCFSRTAPIRTPGSCGARTYAFTALTGAFGEGEDGINQLPHPHRDALARLLLDSGADPNDGQTLYNRHFRENDDHLKLLLVLRSRPGQRRAVVRRLGDRGTARRRLLVEELWGAAQERISRAREAAGRARRRRQHAGPSQRPDAV